MKRLILHIGGNAGAAAGRDIHIQTLNINYPPPPPPPEQVQTVSAGETDRLLHGLMADYVEKTTGGASFGTLSSNQISKAAAYRLKLENLVNAARSGGNRKAV